MSLRRDKKLHLLVASCGPRETSWAQTIAVLALKNPQVDTRAVVDDVVPHHAQATNTLHNQCLPRGQGVFYQHAAYEAVTWADIMICAPLDADNIANMVAGRSDTLLGEILRGWDVEKPLIIVPGMSTPMWSNPITKKHLKKLLQKWTWVRVLTPILWDYEGDVNPRRVPHWNALNDVLGIIEDYAYFLRLRYSKASPSTAVVDDGSPENETKRTLPPELWAIVFDHTNDWELAMGLGAYTKIPIPNDWSMHPKEPEDSLRVYEHELSWISLSGKSTAICQKLSQSPLGFYNLPNAVVKLVLKYGLVDVLVYLEANRPELFNAFDGFLLPIAASVIYPRVEVLDFWKQSRWFRRLRYYDSEIIDLASGHGLVEILEWWWRQSGMPLNYTETALEQASANEHLSVLDWWSDAAAQDKAIILRPGRALLEAVKYGRTDVLEWWIASDIPVSYGEDVVTTACQHGKTNVLKVWRELKGVAACRLDSDALAICTENYNISVLNWWSNVCWEDLLKVEDFKLVAELDSAMIVCAVEKSLPHGDLMRKWWVRNGLFMGMATEQWQLLKDMAIEQVKAVV